LSDNPDVRRLLAACLLAVFAFLATADTFACPDGCQCASSRAAAARCDATGACVFCTAAALISAKRQTVAPLLSPDLIADGPEFATVLPATAPPEQPPRLA
jgi:hypothetical protein